MKKILAGIILFVILSGCSSTEQEIQKRVIQTQVALGIAMTESAVPEISSTPPPSTIVPTMTAIPSTTPAITPKPAITATLGPDAWQSMPVIPDSVSPKMCQVLKLGQMMGNDPNSFSKVGDCESMPPNFLAYIDDGKYNLGEHNNLQTVIDTFSGSFGRFSLASKDGMTASAVMVPLWNSWKDCGVNETPLECEFRIHRPSYAIISFGTNDAEGLVPFETTLRRVIGSTMGHGVVPILATKADNAEGDNSINATIARLAYEYEIPLWNFWLAVQALPNHGLRENDIEHISYIPYGYPTDFSKPENMQYGFNVRNLTALQMLYVVMNGCNSQVTQATATP
jgi:hypothetical protein